MSGTAPRSGVTAVLGPTNTGKTHYAIDRMLGHASGMIGFPLRLLARENYDKVVRLKGAARVALVTGEEKIVPARADYFVCTVESMPLDREVDFLAIDEVQMCADAERGHVFTDRLLRARGRIETIFLGAETIRPVIRALVPEAEFVSRPRLSKLSYSGPRKITRLPRRSAVVAFSINEVYAIAELMRRQRGGTAVVLGALSPRTRNAQVEMYQGGDVDYLVATDAIGMGLNMNIDHVAFAGLRKFDGRNYRRLTVAEIAQIAGRAGRHMSDGTFGPIAEVGPFDEETVTAIEEHDFEPLTGVFWRNADLDFRTGQALLKSLDAPPQRPELMRARDADDKIALGHLLRDAALVDRASGPDNVRLLWDVCQIPDFRKTMADVHANLLARIFRHLTEGDERLPADWVAAQISQLDRVDGDIDTLMARIAHVRTWTYISHRADWLDDAETWQERARTLEDRLSDALHESLTQRFVDRRAAALTRLRDQDELIAVVSREGEVMVENQYVGRLDGFRFALDADASEEGRRTLLAAANKALRREIHGRVDALERAPDGAFAVDEAGGLNWSGAIVARLVKGNDPVSPGVQVLASEYLSSDQRERIRRRLVAWVQGQLEAALERLMTLKGADLNGVPRGLVYRIVEGLGSLPRASVMREVRGLSKEDRNTLRACGIRIGAESLYVPALVKPKAVTWRALLWSVHNEMPAQTPPSPGVVTVPVAQDDNAAFLEACGYRVLGGRAVRVDVLDRVVIDLQRQSRAGPFAVAPTHLNLLGLSMDDTRPILESLGYAARETEEGVRWEWAGKRADGEKRKRPRRPKTAKPPPKGPRKPREKPIDPDSPFAKLRELRLS